MSNIVELTMKFKTVREGEQAVLYNYLGQGTLLKGPQRVFIFRDHLVMLERKTASQYEYLELKDTVGNVTHVPGPCEMFLNPLELAALEVKDAIRIASNHVIVVYRKNENEVIRRIVEGPTVFIPTANEWIHTFEWHGPDQAEADHMIRAARKITQLPMMPEHFSDKVNEVRTIDDTKMVIKLMVYYELADALKMLEETSDPIADMMNAMCADVIQFAGRLTFQEFVSQSNSLNKTDTFTQLLQICDKIGYKLNKIVYRGYTVTIKLQEMHNRNIENRTRMKLQHETQAMEQRIKDFTLSKQQDRVAQLNEVADMKEQHSQTRTKLISDHALQKASEEHAQLLRLKKLRLDSEMRLQAEKNEQEAEYMQRLTGLGVDLTQYLRTKQAEPCSELVVIQS
ncbi:uncharacterized protein [Watersipora subatra]|uniref:uncharacterized protein n=1 Tax=Watersipora subatra TaxID=2589382 RepID=UPI00355B9BE9